MTINAFPNLFSSGWNGLLSAKEKICTHVSIFTECRKDELFKKAYSYFFTKFIPERVLTDINILGTIQKTTKSERVIFYRLPLFKSQMRKFCKTSREKLSESIK